MQDSFLKSLQLYVLGSLELIHLSIHINEVEQNTTKYSKYFWNYVNTLSKSNSIPDDMCSKNTTSNNTTSTCNLFARNFEVIYLKIRFVFFSSIIIK